MIKFWKDLRAATEDACKAPWCGGKPGVRFRCAFCGHKFVVGDLYRGVFTNGTQYHGNPLVCQQCNDTDDKLIETWAAMYREAFSKFWWFCKGQWKEK